MSHMPIIRLLRTDADWQQLYPLIRQLNPGMEKLLFDARLKEMLARGYGCLGVWNQETLIGAAGYWIGISFWCGRYLELDNMIVDKAYRGHGIGGQLMDAMEAKAREEQCDVAFLKAYIANQAGHAFYERKGFHLIGNVFLRPVGMSEEAWNAQMQARHEYMERAVQA